MEVYLCQEILLAKGDLQQVNAFGEVTLIHCILQIPDGDRVLLYHSRRKHTQTRPGRFESFRGSYRLGKTRFGGYFRPKSQIFSSISIAIWMEYLYFRLEFAVA